MHCLHFNFKIENGKYEVEVKTASDMNSGTDSNVFLSIYGDKGEELRAPLKNPRSGKNPFEKGNFDKFDLNLSDVGKVERIAVEQDGKKPGAAWKLEHVKIFHKNTLYT
jgi:hypothetical protein